MAIPAGAGQVAVAAVAAVEEVEEDLEWTVAG